MTWFFLISSLASTLVFSTCSSATDWHAGNSFRKSASKPSSVSVIPLTAWSMSRDCFHDARKLRPFDRSCDGSTAGPADAVLDKLVSGGIPASAWLDLPNELDTSPEAS